ncbi:alpha/beta hydrolase [Antrihabitans cavernicola]|uniref:alpha/beta hydrolase n=1 Tax=Antrihabitans cavernicola TaxID=2495913 RepID=UPI0016593998|nr:alpha/beta hydrolase [Spelaeibacter cavernicola]
MDRVAAWLPAPARTSVLPVQLPQCEGEWVRADGADTSRAILYLHGGAFIACGLNTHRGTVARLSKFSGAPALNVEYRMLPGHPVTTALQDCLDGYRHLLDIGYGSADITICGDSAGGYLVFMTALQLLNENIPAPAGLAVFSPLTDADIAHKVADSANSDNTMFSHDAVVALAKHIETSQAAVSVDCTAGPLLSPVEQDLSGMPPVLIHVGENELLRADAEMMAQRLIEAGTPCELHVWDRQVHDFPLSAKITPEGEAALRSTGRFVRRVTGLESTNRLAQRNSHHHRRA